MAKSAVAARKKRARRASKEQKENAFSWNAKKSFKKKFKHEERGTPSFRGSI